MQRRSFLTLAASMPLAAQNPPERMIEFPAGVLQDKIRGGFLGQVLGDLNGLKHEMKYIAEPGNVRDYTPALPEGAWTDDDTDIEWPYLMEIEKAHEVLLPYSRIATVWKKHINRRIWCAHLYVRQILDLGIDPPLTGRIEFNPWAEFNLSGQFVSESWGLISPGMPQTAARIGIHYTRVSIDSEAIQSTQMMDAMIATAFLTSDMEKILDAGAVATDPKSVMRQIIADIRRWSRQYPKDWRVTRRLTKEKYCLYGGQDMRDRNGVWLNGASTLAALIYGGGDFVETLRHAFNFGWDADNNAAASGTILGVIRGYTWLMRQGWNLKDQYRNTSRDEMPQDETITSYGKRLVAVAEGNITRRGGSKTTLNGKVVYRIPVESPANVELLPELEKRRVELRSQLRNPIEAGVATGPNSQAKAGAAYMAICLDLAGELRQKHPPQWEQAIQGLAGYARVMQAIFFEAPFPAGDAIRHKALAAGLRKPAESIRLAE